MNITYTEALEGITTDRLRGGFFVGWGNPPSPETHLRFLQNSASVILARDGETVVGYVSALSDGILFAYISSLEVLPAYHGQGIGTELMQRMIAHWKSIYAIDLLCDAQLQPFYQRVGMMPVSGMVVRNYARQSGTPEEK